jgi:hypothetical protein
MKDPFGVFPPIEWVSTEGKNEKERREEEFKPHSWQVLMTTIEYIHLNY